MQKKYIYTSLILFIFITSCKKNETDGTMTKMGFYCLKDSGSANEIQYKLYIDNEYKGDIQASAATLSCGDKQLVYFTLDSKEHQIDVKNANNEYLSANYVQIKKNKTSSGCGKDRNKKVSQETNGCFVNAKAGDDCTVVGFYID